MDVRAIVVSRETEMAIRTVGDGGRAGRVSGAVEGRAGTPRRGEAGRHVGGRRATESGRQTEVDSTSLAEASRR